MKRYLITSPRYSGEAELIFNPDGQLAIIDCSQTNMGPHVMAHFKRAVPVSENELKQAFTAEVVIVQSEYQITFDMFWKKYDHKFNKDRCEQLWNRLSQSIKIAAYFGLDKYHRYLRKNSTQIKMHPDTYLRNKAWLNDYK